MLKRMQSSGRSTLLHMLELIESTSSTLSSEHGATVTDDEAVRYGFLHENLRYETRFGGTP